MGIWEYKNFLIISLAVALLSSGFVGLSEEVFADKKGKKNTTKIIHLGTLQIAAHDFYNFDRCGDEACAFENEDHLLNLSTVLFDPKSGDCTFEDAIDVENVECEMRTDEDIEIGGEIRNRENILIFTAASELGEKYVELKAKHGEEKAYDKILKIYHGELKKAFKETFHLKWPKPQYEGVITNDHNSALRSVHDMLPGEIIINGETVSVFQEPFFSVPEKLSKKDRKQPSGPLDGLLDIAFLPFCPFPGFCINLLDADVSFAILFTNTDFEEFMIQTSDGKYDADEEVTQLIIEQFAIGINLP